MSASRLIDSYAASVAKRLGMGMAHRGNRLIFTRAAHAQQGVKLCYL